MKLWFSKDKDETSACEAPAAQPAAPAPQPAAPAPVPVAPEPPPPPSAPEPPPPAAPEPPPPPAAPLQNTQRELYRSLMDALYDAVLVVDDKGHVVDSNARVEHTFGYATNEMWDMPLQRIIKGFGQHVLAQLAGPLGEGRPVIIDGRGVRKDGSTFNAEITVGRVRLGRSENMLMSIRDIGKRMLAMQEKMRAQLASAPAQPAAAATKVVRLVRKA